MDKIYAVLINFEDWESSTWQTIGHFLSLEEDKRDGFSGEAVGKRLYNRQNNKTTIKDEQSIRIVH